MNNHFWTTDSNIVLFLKDRLVLPPTVPPNMPCRYTGFIVCSLLSMYSVI